MLSMFNWTNWVELKADLLDRLSRPLQSPAFIFYCAFVIVATGVGAVALTYHHESAITERECGHIFSHGHIVLSMAAYYMGLITASAVDLILSVKNASKDLRGSIVMVGIGALLLGVALVTLSLMNEHLPIVSYSLAILGMLLSWIIWWITNSENQNLGMNPHNATPTPMDLSGNTANYIL